MIKIPDLKIRAVRDGDIYWGITSISMAIDIRMDDSILEVNREEREVDQ